MGIFSNLFSRKKTEQEIYWENNQDELQAIKENGQKKLTILNDSFTKMDICKKISELILLKTDCTLIMDWFDVLEDKKCPFHIVGGVALYRDKFLKKFNSSIIGMSKSSTDDFIAARDALCKNASNYELCASELLIQVQRGWFYGTSDSWINKVKILYTTNAILSLLDIYVECGLSHDIAYSKDSSLIRSFIPFVNGSDEDSVFKTYAYTVANRYNLQHYRLPKLDSDTYGLNLPNNEFIHHCIHNVTLLEEKVVRRDIAYSGVKWTSGILRAGTINAVGQSITDYVPQDIGKLFITSKRLLFVGMQRHLTKAINTKNILSYFLYNDGVLLCQANKKAILFKFDTTIDYGIYQVPDGMNEFISVLNRVLENSTEQNLLKQINII